MIFVDSVFFLFFFYFEFENCNLLMKVKLLSSDSEIPYGHQAPPSMGFSRQRYWSGLPFPSPRLKFLERCYFRF